MKLEQIYSKNSIKDKISFEVFPPKDEPAASLLLDELAELKRFNPAFISLTWGAGGSYNSSYKLIETIGAEGFEVMPHFTCVCSSKEFVREHIKCLDKLKISNILALRGDIPDDKSRCCHDFKYANELVEYLKLNSSLSIGVAGYPEGHIEAPDLEADIVCLKNKINAGANAIFTQLFFDNNKFFSYVEKVRRQGINIPIVAGVMPILSVKQIEKMISLANISIPQELQTALEKYGDNSKSLKDFGVDYISKQCGELVKFGVDGLHFFTLNKSNACSRILDNIL